MPGTINRYLRDYQRDGVCFLYKHYTAGRGAILGDDMGLGKTVQVSKYTFDILVLILCVLNDTENKFMANN